MHENILDDNSDIVPEGEELTDLVKKLREELKTARKERDEYLSGWQRAKADYVNQARDYSNSKMEFASYADEAFFEDLLPVLDSFGMAFLNKEAWEKAPKEWRTGVEYIHSQLVTALKNHHIKEYGPKVGDAFDTNFHAAISSAPVSDIEKDHTVLQLVNKGYEKNGKVLRPAGVIIGEHKKE